VHNGFAEDEARILVTAIPDTVMKPEVWHYKYRMTDLASTAKVHYVHVLTAPSKTFVVGYTSFRDFDGTSCFNLIKGFVATYYDGEAPLVRPAVGSPELDLRLDTENEELKKKLGALPALRCAVGTSYTMAVQFGRWLLSREVFDGLGCASPECCSVIESLSLEETANMTAALKARQLKPFAYLMATAAEAAKSVPKQYQVARPTLLTQVSCQSRYYMPRVERNVCGNWLIGLGSRPTLDEMSSESWASQPDRAHRELLRQRGVELYQPDQVSTARKRARAVEGDAAKLPELKLQVKELKARVDELRVEEESVCMCMSMSMLTLTPLKGLAFHVHRGARLTRFAGLFRPLLVFPLRDIITRQQNA